MYGKTPEEAIKNGLDAAKSWLETAREFNDPIPRPRESNSGKFVTRVPKSLHARLIARAKQEGVSMNALVTAYLAEALGKREVKKSVGRRALQILFIAEVFLCIITNLPLQPRFDL